MKTHKWRQRCGDLLLFYHIILFCLPLSQFVYHSHYGSDLVHQHEITEPALVSKSSQDANWHMHLRKLVFFLPVFLLGLPVLLFTSIQRLSLKIQWHGWAFLVRPRNRAPPL